MRGFSHYQFIPHPKARAKRSLEGCVTNSIWISNTSAAALAAFLLNHKDIAMNNTTPPPEDPVWVSIRMRYEQNHETVEQIGESVGLSKIALAMRAKKLGWKLRNAKAVTVEPGKKETTTATIKRVKELLQRRVSMLEAELQDIAKNVNALATERQIRSTNTLVRTIEKVIDLERKDRARRAKQTRDFKYFDDEQRRQLADKIGKLQSEWRGAEAVAYTAEPGSGGAEQSVALLGQRAQPAAAADSVS
jgi:hypothetical protein